MEFNFGEVTNIKESKARMTPGIKNAKFKGINYATVKSQKTGEDYNTFALTLDVEGYGEYTQNFFEPTSNERNKMQWGESASSVDHFLVLIREILEAICPEILTKLDSGKIQLAGTFKQIVSKVKQATDPKIGTDVQVKFVPQNNGYSAIPSFVARITKTGDVAISTKVIGHNLTLTTSEMTRIKNAESASPTEMKPTSNSNNLQGMLDSIDLDASSSSTDSGWSSTDDSNDDLPF